MTPCQPTGTVARHPTTLAALSSGLVRSKRTPLPQIATQVANGARAERRSNRFAQWRRHDQSTAEVSGVPYATRLLAHLALQTLVLIIDGRGVGRSVVYTGRGLPLAWLIRQGRQGRYPEAMHGTLGDQGRERQPVGAPVVLLGVDACDGPDLRHTWQRQGGATSAARLPDCVAGRRALASRYSGGVESTRDAHRVTRGVLDRGGVWADHAGLLWGQRLSRAALLDEQHAPLTRRIKCIRRACRVKSFFRLAKSRFPPP